MKEIKNISRLKKIEAIRDGLKTYQSKNTLMKLNIYERYYIQFQKIRYMDH